MSAEPSQLFPGVGKENIAYNFGAEVGSEKKIIKLGVAWFHIEANAFPSQFVDSDVLDGVTNREGLLVYLSRQLVKNMDFNIQAFGSDAIDSNPSFGDSVKDSERVRTQIDLVYKF